MECFAVSYSTVLRSIWCYVPLVGDALPLKLKGG